MELHLESVKHKLVKEGFPFFGFRLMNGYWYAVGMRIEDAKGRVTHLHSDLIKVSDFLKRG